LFIHNLYVSPNKKDFTNFRYHPSLPVLYTNENPNA